jgi:hypothetical protein
MKWHLLWTQPCVRILKSTHRFGKFPLEHKPMKGKYWPYRGSSQNIKIISLPTGFGSEKCLKILVLELRCRLQRHITVTLSFMFRQQCQMNLSDCHRTVCQCTCQTWIQTHVHSNTSLKKSCYQFAIVYACVLKLWHEFGEHSDSFMKTCIMWKASNYVGRQWQWIQWINHFTQLVTSPQYPLWTKTNMHSFFAYSDDV